MLAKVNSFVLVGIDAIRCEVEVDVSQRGLSKVTRVGRAQSPVKESVERVRRAMINSGFAFPLRAVLMNLAPADVKNEWRTLNLPVAVGLLRATNSLKDDRHREYLIAGELALDGRARRIRGALSLALLARQLGLRGVVVPAENRREAADVKGPDAVERAILVAASGSHNRPMVWTDPANLGTGPRRQLQPCGGNHPRRLFVACACGRDGGEVRACRVVQAGRFD